MKRIPSNIDEEVESVSSILGGKADAATLKEELLRYHNRYRMDMDSSKKAVLKDHGYHPAVADKKTAVRKKISEIKEADTNIEIIAKVVDIAVKNTKNGPAVLMTLGIADDSGLSSVSVWEPEDYPEIGRTYRFTDCYVKEFKGVLNINLGNRGRFVEDEISIEPDTIDNTVQSALDLDDIRADMKGVSVRFTIEGTFDERIETKKGPMDIYRCIVKGKEKKMVISFWSNHFLKEGMDVCLSKVDVKEYNNQLKLDIDDSCIVIRVD